MRREVLVVAVVVLAATLGVTFALLGGKDGSAGDSDTTTAIVAPANEGETTPTYAPQHQRLAGAYRDGIVSTILTSAIGLVDEATGRQTTFLVPVELQSRIDFDHMRADASSGVPFRIYYRRAGDDLIMRGFTHPRPGGGADAP